MEKETSRGGKRDGAGRKAGDKSRLQLWVTAEEKELLNETLATYRAKQAELEKPCPKCGSSLVKKISAISRKEYLECTGANCIFTKDV